MRLRPALKRVVVLAATLVTAPLALPALLAGRIGWDGPFQFGARLLSLLPGRSGQYLRAGFYAGTLAYCPCDVAVGFLAFIESPMVRLGHGVYIGSFSTVGLSVIEDNVLIASRVVVGSSRMPASAPVHIGASSWIGESALVLADVGQEATIGAGCVVTQDVPDAGMAVGNPVRLL